MGRKELKVNESQKIKQINSIVNHQIKTWKVRKMAQKKQIVKPMWMNEIVASMEKKKQKMSRKYPMLSKMMQAKVRKQVQNIEQRKDIELGNLTVQMKVVLKTSQQ